MVCLTTPSKDEMELRYYPWIRQQAHIKFESNSLERSKLVAKKKKVWKEKRFLQKKTDRKNMVDKKK